MQTRKLNAQALDSLDRTVAVPTYDRSAMGSGIVHLGVGGFHRAHQAMYLDALMNAGAAPEWGITGVGLLPGDRRMNEVMAEQDGLYALVEKAPDGAMQARVIGSTSAHLLAPDDPEAVLQRLTAPETKIVTLTITEGGYPIDEVTNDFDPDAPGVREDARPGSTPATAVGYLVEALARRRAAGTAPFTVASCDNIPGNGDAAARSVLGLARVRDAELASWIEGNVAFPNSMVDRITPATTADDRSTVAERFGIADEWPVVCEPFAQWVLEDRFPQGRPALEEVGVHLVDDVIPYELMKLRMLNAGHQALCYLARLHGYGYADESTQDDVFGGFVQSYMEQEALPTLPPVPGVDLHEYARTLVERFANPAIGDTLARLCTDSSDRIPKFLLPVIRQQLADDGPIHRSALVVAAWARYAEGTDEHGQPIEIADRRRDQVTANAAQQATDPLAFVRDRALFGDLADDERFTTEYLAALESLRERGARETAKLWLER